MANVPIKLVIRNYDSITPLIAGDVAAERIDLTLDRETPMARFTSDRAYQAGELSLAQYLRRLAAGDMEIIGLPIFVARGFRHRCFFVRRGSELSSLADLAGKRIGIDAWPATGHTWSRALLREAGVDITSIQWSIGPMEVAAGQTTSAAGLPPHARPAPEGKTQVELLITGELDALIMSTPPRAFYEENSPVTRLFPSFREVEEEYAARVGFWPCFHIIGLRASVVEDHPWVAQSLFVAFEEARKLAAERRQSLADATPWMLNEFEHVAQLLGPHWQDYGVEPNRAAVATLCEEGYAQGVIPTLVNPSSVFADFEAALSAS